MKECLVCSKCFNDSSSYCSEDGNPLKRTLTGDVLLDGRYQLRRRLGQGGMGVVYKARHLFLKTTHAIKVILPDLVGNDSEFLTRFRQEAMAAAAIRHHNIIAVTDYGVVNNSMPFLVMEYIQGKSLHEVLVKEGKLSPERALEIMEPIAAGVGAAHRRSIVHRDLKPLNIMIEDELPIDEAVKLLDFGLAKIKSGELLGSFVAAKTTGLMGSPFYMAPEQWSEEEPDKCADIYSLGIILYQMLAGDVPFKGPSIPSIMKKHLLEKPPHFAELGAMVPPEVEEVVRHTLEKEPSHRPPTVQSFIGELREAVQASNVTQRALRDHMANLLATVTRTTDDQLAGTISSDFDIQSSARQPDANALVEERHRREEEEKRLQVETEAEQRLRHEAENQARLEAEARRRQQEEEDARRRAEEAARLRREREESERRAAEAAARKHAEELAARKRAEEAARKQAEEEAARKRAEEEEAARKKAEEEEAARKRAEEEEAARLRAEEEAAARKKAEEEEAARLAEQERLRAEAEERARLKAEAEALARRRAEEEARRKEEEEAARLAAEEEVRKRAEEEARQRRLEEEAEAARLAAAEAERKRVEEEARLEAEAKRKQEAERQRQREEEEQRQREEEQRRRAEEEERVRKLEEEEAAAARKRAEEEEAARKLEEEEAARKRAEEAEAARLRAEEEAAARKKAEEEEAARRRVAEEAERERVAKEARRRAEEEARKRAEDEEAQRLAEAQAARVRVETEALRKKLEAEERRKAEAENARLEEEARRRREAEAARAEQQAPDSQQKQQSSGDGTGATISISEATGASEAIGVGEAMRAGEATGENAAPFATQHAPQVVTQHAPEANFFTTRTTTAHVPSNDSSSFATPSFPSLEVAPKESSRMVFIGIAAVVLVVLLGGGATALYFATRPATSDPSQPTVPGKATGTDRPAANPNGEKTTPAQSRLVLIPGGVFQMGRNDVAKTSLDYNQFPAHAVNVKSFYLDKTEVTNAEYAEFVRATGHPAPKAAAAPYWTPWNGAQPPAGQEQWPVRNVSVADAVAFAAWRTKRDGVDYRLPTEEEWEYAARNGGESTLYPWGQKWVGQSANVDAALPKPVGSFVNGATRAGALDMIGNVWEWTSSEASIYPGNNEREIEKEDKGQVIVRGGSYQSKASGGEPITAASRQWVPRETKHPTIGFRLVRDSPNAPSP